MNRQRVDCLRLPGFAKPLSRHICEKVADTLSLETEWSEIGHCKSRIADSKSQTGYKRNAVFTSLV